MAVAPSKLLASLLAALLPAIMLAPGLAACRKAAEPPAEAPRAVAPETAVAVTAAEVPLAIVPATVSLPPAARVAVMAPFAGAVRQLHVIEGQEVRAGQLLATVISRDALSLAANRARADARVALAEANARRMEQLAAEGVVAAARADEALAALKEAQVDRDEAARILARGGASEDGIVRLAAPIAGRVAEVAVETGGPLDGMTAPFVIEAGERYALKMQLPERLAGAVRPGMTVLLPGGVRGALVSLSPGLDPATRSVQALARIDPGSGLLAGSAVEVTILDNVSGATVSVPASALTALRGRDVVFVQTDQGFRPVPVQVAGRAGSLVFIREGLTAGQSVATSGLPELKMQAGD